MVLKWSSLIHWFEQCVTVLHVHKCIQSPCGDKRGCFHVSMSVYVYTTLEIPLI